MGVVILEVACKPSIHEPSVSPPPTAVGSVATTTRSRSARDDEHAVKAHIDKMFRAEACPTICDEEELDPCQCELTHELEWIEGITEWLVFRVTERDEDSTVFTWYAAGRVDGVYHLLGGDYGLESLCTVHMEADASGSPEGGMVAAIEDITLGEHDLLLDCNEGPGRDRYLRVCPGESEVCSTPLWTHRYDGDTLIYQADIDFDMGWFIPKVRVGDPSKAEGQEADQLPGVRTNPPQQLLDDEEDIEDEEDG